MSAVNKNDGQVKKVSEVLDDLKNIKSQEDNKICDLETQIGNVERTESSLKIVVKSLEDTIREDKEKLCKLEAQLITSKNSYDGEKSKWLFTLEGANKKIMDLSDDLKNVSALELHRKDDEISELKQTWTDRKSLYESEVQKQKKRLAEAETRHQNVTAKIDEVFAVAEQTRKKIETQKLESEQMKVEKEEMQGTISKLECVAAQKSEYIKELEVTVKSNRDILYTDDEYDSAVAKLKKTRAENKRLKLDNMAYDEENERLLDENVKLKDFATNRLPHGLDLVDVNKKLRQDNKNLGEELEAQMAYHDMYEAVQRELEAIRIKTEMEKETLIARISRLECEKMNDEAKVASLERANLEKTKTISQLSIQNSLPY